MQEMNRDSPESMCSSLPECRWLLTQHTHRYPHIQKQNQLHIATIMHWQGQPAAQKNRSSAACLELAVNPW